MTTRKLVEEHGSFQVHSCGGTHTYHDCKVEHKGNVLVIHKYAADCQRMTIAEFTVWDWWREIEEDSDGSEG